MHTDIKGANGVGIDALFIADSGAFYNTLTPAAAADFNLHHVTPGEDYIEGFGGSARAYVTQVDTFTIFNIPVPKVAFVVAGNDLPGGAVGLLGRDRVRPGRSQHGQGHQCPLRPRLPEVDRHRLRDRPAAQDRRVKRQKRW